MSDTDLPETMLTNLPSSLPIECTIRVYVVLVSSHPSIFSKLRVLVDIMVWRRASARKPGIETVQWPICMDNSFDETKLSRYYPSHWRSTSVSFTPFGEKYLVWLSLCALRKKTKQSFIFAFSVFSFFVPLDQLYVVFRSTSIVKTA